MNVRDEHERELRWTHYREPDPNVGRADRAPRAWPKFMTARVAADYSDSSPWTVRRHVHPIGRRGRTFVYSIDSVEEWMRGQTMAAQRNDAANSTRRPSVARKPHERLRDRAKSRDRSGEVVETHEHDVAA